MDLKEEEEFSTESGRNVDWAELTQECLTNIFSRLSFAHLWLGPMFVCKSWMLVTKDPSLHSVFDLETHFDSSRTESPTWWTPEFEMKIDSMLRSVVVWSEGSLTQIRTRHCPDRSLNFAAKRCPNLEVLKIKSCPNVTNESITSIALNCPRITKLDISYCYEITHESLFILGRHCPNITILKRNFMNYLDPSRHRGIIPEEYLNACPQDGDSEAAAIGKSMPNLEQLELQFSKLSAKGLSLICEGCLNLKYLDLSGCVNMTSRDIVNASSNLKNVEIKKPNFYIPRSVFHTERYGHWNLYDERFQTDVFRI